MSYTILYILIFIFITFLVYNYLQSKGIDLFKKTVKNDTLSFLDDNYAKKKEKELNYIIGNNNTSTSPETSSLL